MDDSEPPGDKDCFDCNIEENLEKVILEPIKDKEIIAFLNPSVHQDSKNGPWPFIYRTRRKGTILGEYSTIDFRNLNNPVELSDENKILIKPEYDYERFGCEDPRMTKKGDVYYITYVAYDGITARVALATTKDFRKIEKHGIISPKIRLEEAIDLVGDEFYKEVWKNHLIKMKERLKYVKLENKEIGLWDKDAAIHFENNKWYLFHRFDPHIQIAITNKIEDLKDDDFWRKYLKEIKNYIFMKNEESWENEKIGLGSPLIKLENRIIGLWHGVNKNLDYSASFFEVEPNTYKLKRKIKEPLFRPDKDIHRFEYINEKGEKELKKVIFPTGVIKWEDSLYVYSGSADKTITVKRVNLNKLTKKLDSPENLVYTKYL